MPRIRSIRPEFWTRRKLAAASPEVRLVMIGVIQLADDEGRLEADPVILRSQLFPAGGIGQAEFNRAIEYLASIDEIVVYEVDGAPYASIPGWRDKKSWQYQQISKAQPSRLPGPLPEDSGNDPAEDGTPPGADAEESESPPEPAPDRSGTTPGGSREQGTGRGEDTPLPPPGGGGGGPSASPPHVGEPTDADAPLTAGERAAAEVVAGAIERGDVRLDPDEDVLGLEHDIVGAEAAKRDASRARDGNALAAIEARLDETKRRHRDAISQRRSAAVAALRQGTSAARPLLQRWQAADVLVGPKEHRVPLRVACLAAKKGARADERDRRRDAKGRGDAV
jgi:hypothetical protein